MKRVAGISAIFLSCVAFVTLDQSSLADDAPKQQPGAVYAKIVLPIEAPRLETRPIVESWIAKNLNKRGKTKLRAMTGWIRLAEKGEKHSTVWDATVDGESWGCPVDGRVVERTADGKVRVELSGWTPVGAEVKGQKLSAEMGSRRIAVVDSRVDDSGIAYIALFVGAPTPNQKAANGGDRSSAR